MEATDWPLKMVLALVLGAVIGLEREINERKSIKKDDTKKGSAILGLRSFSLISGLGALAGLLYFQFPIITAIITAAFSILIITYYFIDSKITLDIGTTTELAIFYTYIIGFVLAVGILPIQVVIALTVVLVLLMSRKENIKNFVEDIHRNEINALISFAILAFVILPFLPNYTYSLSDFGVINDLFKNIGFDMSRVANLELINPFKLWFIVVLITGIDLLGYILERSLGKKKGWLIASVVGGFVSSTATIISIAQESKSVRNINSLLAGAIFSNMVSFIPTAVLLITLNSKLFLSFFPVLLGLIISSLVVGIYFLTSSKNSDPKNFDEQKVGEQHKIFDLVAALRFMGIFLFINIFSKLALEFFGSVGFLTTNSLGALTGFDAVVINTSQLAGSTINLSLGVWALILANAINLLAKSFYSFLQGSREFAFKLLISMLIIITSSVITALVF